MKRGEVGARPDNSKRGKNGECGHSASSLRLVYHQSEILLVDSATVVDKVNIDCFTLLIDSKKDTIIPHS